MKVQMKVFSTIFIAVLIIGGLLWNYFWPEDDTANSNTAVNSSVITGGEGYELYDTEDGDLRFINNEYGYQLTLPEGWDAFFSEDAPDDLSFVWFEDSIAQAQTGESELLQGMKIDIFADLAVYSSLDEWYAAETEWLEPNEKLEEIDTTVGGEQAKKIKVDVLGYTLSTFVLHGDKQFIIAGYVGDTENKEEYSAIYSKILSTFEFLE